MKTLEEYHTKYPARRGDTPEMFARYEEFCEKNPCPSGEAYRHWYVRLAAHMEVEITPVSGPIFPLTIPRNLAE